MGENLEGKGFGVMKKMVVICIPAYNHADKLVILLDSIKEQTYKDYQIVITDDSDNASIKNMLQGYAMLPIRYKKNNMPKGATGNTNYAIKLAQEYSPQYIKVMHHDDFFTYADSLQKMVDALDENPNAEICFSGAYLVDGNKKRRSYISEKTTQDLRSDFRVLFMKNCIGGPSSVLVRNNGIFLDENLTWLVDVEWYLHILGGNNQFIFIETPLLSYGVGKNQLTNQCMANPDMIMNEYIYIFGKYPFLCEREYVDHLVEQMNRYMQWSAVYAFCYKKDGKKIYIYGVGGLGNRCLEILVNRGFSIEGFVVSKKQENANDVGGYQVYQFDELKSGDVKLIIALKEEYAREVIPSVQDAGIEYILMYGRISCDR